MMVAWTIINGGVNSKKGKVSGLSDWLEIRNKNLVSSVYADACKLT